ncbi:MAG: FtsH protease activity modulator HflK [Gammaproteobacteria bacterium]|nr:FtsH protease activity modulator HflK [Gammaproteobacteria bacterium]
MAWNDPGRKQNPWQRRPDQGPPDLDAMLRRLRQRLRAMFGGGPRPAGGNGGGGGGGGGPSGAGFGFLVAGVFVIWLMTGVYQNDAAERSVVTRFGKYVRTTTAGLHMRMPWPIERRQVVNVTEVLTHPARTRMLTQDEALVDIDLAVQYRRADPIKFAFNVRDPEETLAEVSGSAIREIIGQSRLESVLGVGRQEISLRTKELVQRTIAAYNTGLEVISVNLQDVNVPDQVSPAQKDAIKAREDKDRATLAAKTYANDIVPKARGLAASQLEGAQAYRARVIAAADGETTRFAQLAAEYERAPEVTRRRLYLETMEQVLGSSAKVIVDTKGSGNMLYLPLDRLIERRSQRNPPVDTPPTIRMEDGSPIEPAAEPDAAMDPRARKER